MDSSQRQYLGIGFLAVILLTIVVIGLAEVNRMDAEKHISERACGASHPSCPGKLECSAGFSPDRFGVNISGARCVTQKYLERYCGVFETAVVVSTAESTSWRSGECRRLSPTAVVTDPGRLVDAAGKLLPPPDGERILERYNLTSLADAPSSAHDPIEPQFGCRWAAFAIYNASYSPSNRMASINVANTGIRNLNVTVEARHEDETLARSSGQALSTGKTYTFNVTVETSPDMVMATSVDCPGATVSTTNVTIG